MTAGPVHLVLLGGDGGLSGVPRHIEQICKVLMSELNPRYRITVISEPDRGGYTFTQDMPIAHIGLPDLASSTNPGRVLRGLRTLRAALCQDPPDIIWAHARLPVLLARVIARDETPLIVTFHGSPFLGRQRAAALVAREIERRLMRRTRPHEVVFLSEADRSSFDGLHLGRHRSHVIPNVAPDLDFPPLAPPERPTLVMTTRDSPQKNLDGAARVFAHLPDTTELLLLGMGTQSRALQQRFATLLPEQALSRVTFHGPTQAVARHLRSAHGYLMTSRYEGMSLGALEAFAAGLPVFLPDVGGCAEILHAHPMGAMIDPSNPGQAASTILPILNTFCADPHTCAALNTEAYSGAFSPEIWAEQIKNLLQQTISGQSTQKSLD